MSNDVGEGSALWFGMSLVLSSLAPVEGEVSLVRSHPEPLRDGRALPRQDKESKVACFS